LLRGGPGRLVPADEEALHRVAGIEFFRRGGRRYAAIGHQIGEVGVPQRLFDKLFDEDDGRAGAREIGGYLQYPVDDQRGEAAGGLVENEQARIADHALADGENLLLAPTE